MCTDVCPNGTGDQRATNNIALRPTLCRQVIITGAWAEKFSLEAFEIFTACWPFLVYYPVAHWVWNPDGFFMKYGVLDFAGGLTIHATSGVAAVVVASFQER